MGFPEIGVPQNGWLIRENPAWMIWGLPLVQETTHIYIHIYRGDRYLHLNTSKSKYYSYNRK